MPVEMLIRPEDLFRLVFPREDCRLSMLKRKQIVVVVNADKIIDNSFREAESYERQKMS